MGALMTVIAWDGTTLAADKQATSNGLKRTVTKIRKVGDCLIASSGDFDVVQELYAWFERGASPSDWPEIQKDKDSWSRLYVIKSDKSIWVYERRPYPHRLEDSSFACGSGRDYALAAMHLGCSSAVAVQVACNFESGCGMGMDLLSHE